MDIHKEIVCRVSEHPKAAVGSSSNFLVLINPWWGRGWYGFRKLDSREMFKGPKYGDYKLSSADGTFPPRGRKQFVATNIAQIWGFKLNGGNIHQCLLLKGGGWGGGSWDNRKHSFNAAKEREINIFTNRNIKIFKKPKEINLLLISTICALLSDNCATNERQCFQSSKDAGAYKILPYMESENWSI